MICNGFCAGHFCRSDKRSATRQPAPDGGETPYPAYGICERFRYSSLCISCKRDKQRWNSNFRRSP
ncbi:hypothetical protein MC77_013605 [Citrobacter koseri]|nr:hypothetical protein MC77_013605 [Citrobacter koseri]